MSTFLPGGGGVAADGAAVVTATGSLSAIKQHSELII